VAERRCLRNEGAGGRIHGRADGPPIPGSG
jgi:hypothetical protein